MKVAIPEFAMVVVIGPSGSGKSTFCRRHFLPTEILSSDVYRGLVMDDEDSLEATTPAFEALHWMLAKRLELGRLTVVDATNVQKEARSSLLKIASTWHALKVAIIVDTPEEVCHERNKLRPNRQFGPHVVRNHIRDLRRSMGDLKKEGWHKVFVIKPEEMDQVEVVRERIWSRRPEVTGPFDIIGDVHGCREELLELLQKLGWTLDPELAHPEARKLIFVGDLVDRGPDSVGVLRFVMGAVKSGAALCVPGNHDSKLARALSGRKVSTGHGLSETLAALEEEPPEFRQAVQEFIEGLVSHAVLDEGRLCVAHAGLRQEMQGRGSKAVREFCLYGETTGEIDEFGLPVRYNWAKNYRGKAMVVFGHTPVPEPEWLNNTIDIDTGCCFGGSLTALRYPEKELVSVPAKSTYAEPARPIGWQSRADLPAEEGDLLDIKDVLGRRFVPTRLGGRVTIREENAIAALEIMSRFSADPRWIIHLPPTMSPCRTSKREGFLEHPEDALDYYRQAGVAQVVCQEKHMGSRALAVVCRDEAAAAKRFGVSAGQQGAILTRTGRRFFDDLVLEQELVKRASEAAEKCGLYDELETSWLLIDLEMMPWSAKAVGLLKDQYGPVGAAAVASGQLWKEVASKALARGVENGDLLLEAAEWRAEAALKFREAYRRYCWDVTSLEDYVLAPFHLLASEKQVHVDKNHLWHMETLGRLCDADPALFRRTPYRLVNLDSEKEVQEAIDWWLDLTAKGGEGMVVKPLDFVAHGPEGILQPAIKCRGPEYLRIIYGPEYLLPEHLEALRQRGLGRKRGLAIREFALGIEALERFTQHGSLRTVHECVFGILALESEPIDPRL